MSARQLNRLAKAKGLDPLLGGSLNAELENSDEEEESEEEVGNGHFVGGSTVVASAFALDSDSSSSDDEEEEYSDLEESAHNEEPSGTASKGTPAELHGNASHDNPARGDDDDDNLHHPTSPLKDATLIASGESVEDGDNHDASRGDASQPPVALSKEPTPTDTKVAPAPTAAPSKGRNKEAEKEVDDDEYLDSVISELATAAAEGGESFMGQIGVSSPLAKLLRCDPRCLKIDQELRRKFGGGRGNEGGVPPGGRARKTRRMGMMPRGMGNSQAASGLLARKRLVVSTPKEDWPKPPSFVGGGLGMKQCESPPYLPPWQLRAHGGAAWFEFEMSSSLTQLQRKFQAVQGNHDPNLLAAFASRAPYHAEALLQLAMVFAHTGQMDRASEFVGRSLYVLESAFIEAFKPLDGACRLDAALMVNRVYLAAMFRHMQMSGMVGGARTALEVGRLLLSVDPLGDPMGCLLALDSFALASRQGGFLLELHRSRLPVGFSPDRLSRLRSEGRSCEGMNEDPGVTVQDLPGLSLSACLAVLDSERDIVAAREAMASALLRFPVMLEPLLEKCGMSPRTTKYPQDWQSVMEHPHFGMAADRLPRGHVLLHLARIFALRGGEIWKHERAQELLYDGAGIALQSLITAPGSKAAAAAGGARPATSTVRTGGERSDSDGVCPCAPEREVLERAYRKGSPTEKYLDLPSSDFEEAFALLPQDANFLHPRLMGANFMNERVRLRLPEVPGGWVDRGGFDEFLAGVQARDAGEQMGRRGDVGGWLRDPGGAARRVRAGNLDPRAPLAQLFWQTLLPWNVFPTPSRPSPPPPDWL